MGYTALIRRQSDSEAPHLRAVDVIDRETERMAEIVKKIGRITRFETKEYVGGASILDLERSAQEGARDLPAPEHDPDLELGDAPDTGAGDNPIERARDHDDDIDDDEPTRRIGFDKPGPRGRG